MDSNKEIEFSLIPGDFVALGEYHERQQSKGKTWLYVGLLILMVAALIFRVREFAKEAGQVIAIIALVVAMSGGLIWYLNRHRIAARGVRKELAKGKNARLLEPRKLTISPDGISNWSADSAGMTMWTAVEKIAVTKGHAFFFYLNTAAAIILPRRAFPSDVEFMDFVETAQRFFDLANKETGPA